MCKIFVCQLSVDFEKLAKFLRLLLFSAMCIVLNSTANQLLKCMSVLLRQLLANTLDLTANCRMQITVN